MPFRLKLLYIYAAGYIVFADAYLFVTWMKPITILNYLIVMTALFYKKREIYVNITKTKWIFFALIIYMFIINIFQNDMQRAFSMLVTTLPIPFVLSLFSRSIETEKVIFFYAKFYLIYNAIFSFLQMSGIYITAGEIFSKLPFMGVSRGFVKELMYQGLRISGASASSIGLASLLGIIFLLFFYYKDNNANILTTRERYFYLILIVLLIFMTQTRSLIFSLPIVIFVTSLLINKQSIKNYFYIFGGAVVLIILFYSLLPMLEEMFPRLFLSVDQDGSVVQRLQSNVFGIVGVFHSSFWTGVAYDDIYQAIILGYQKVGLFVGTYFITEVTNHNQPAYFFKYYGFIGFSFFVAIIVGMFKISNSKKHNTLNKKILTSIVLYYLLFTMTHNNNILMDYYLWMFLGLHLVTVKKKAGK